jgi:hypothetical protein
MKRWWYSIGFTIALIAFGSIAFAIMSGIFYLLDTYVAPFFNKYPEYFWGTIVFIVLVILFRYCIFNKEL